MTSTDSNIEYTSALLLSDALKSNTALTKLNLRGENKRNNTHKLHPSTIHSFSILIKSTGNEIGAPGAISLSDALKSNTTLTQLNIGSEHETERTHK